MVVGERYKYVLKGLSPEHSLDLFMMIAFGEKREHVNSIFVELGKKIVEHCSNVPLAIRIVGSLLYGQNEDKWRSFQQNAKAKIQGENKIMNILKLSYDNLESTLKTCFTYCSLFPKDYLIRKDKLIRLWIAQGYVEPFEDSQSLEEAGEEYVSILLRRCFFQDVSKNEWGSVNSFKIHDLMHDVAQKVAGKEYVVLNPLAYNLGDKARHTFDLRSKSRGSCFTRCKIRSYIQGGFYNNFPLAKLVENLQFLRTLNLHNLDIKSLPDGIGNLLHLRYLDLSFNRDLEALPDSLTKLHNLLTLDLFQCSRLKELPKDLNKLRKLRHLDVDGCKLSHMPSGLEKLSSLCVLTKFVVGEEDPNMKHPVGQLEELQALTNLRGGIGIEIPRSYMGVKEGSKPEKYLKLKKNLSRVGISLNHNADHHTLLEKLELPPLVRDLFLSGYDGATLPVWWLGGMDNLATCFPNLASIFITSCPKLQYLPSLSKLPHLTSLFLAQFDELEYIEDMPSCNSNGATSLGFTFFPSLKSLTLCRMPKLKGCWRRGEDFDGSQLLGSNNVWQPSFPHLYKLHLRRCDQLTSFPSCPSVESLTLVGVNEELRIIRLEEEQEKGSGLKLRELTIGNLDHLKTLPTEGLTSMSIEDNEELNCLSGLAESMKSCSALRSLDFWELSSLESLSGAGWEHLTALESLKFCWTCKLRLGDDDMMWTFLQQSLRQLVLEGLSELVTLPKGMQYLTSLQKLVIERCDNLISLPEWISCLSSLQYFGLYGCRRIESLPEAMRELTSLQSLDIESHQPLIERCQEPDGQDWSKIQHVPSVSINWRRHYF